MKSIIIGVVMLLMSKTDILNKITTSIGVSDTGIGNLISQLGTYLKWAGIILIVYALIKYVVSPILSDNRRRY